jgi:Protein of unknown function (DUF3108)
MGNIKRTDQLLFRLIVAAWALVAIPHMAHATPTEVVANYRILKSGVLVGTVEEKFVRTGDSYRITSDTRTAGALSLLLRDRITVTAEGRIGNTGLEPAQYEFRRQKDAGKNVSARFDWALGKIVSQHDQKTESFSLPLGTVDRISAMYQFMFNTPRTEQIIAWVSGGKKAEEYSYRKRGEPVLKVGNSQIETVHYERENEPGRAKAQLWLAKNQHYLPVRIVFEDSHGLTLEQSLVSLQTK